LAATPQRCRRERPKIPAASCSPPAQGLSYRLIAGRRKRQRLLWVRLGQSAMSAQCPACPTADLPPLDRNVNLARHGNPQPGRGRCRAGQPLLDPIQRRSGAAMIDAGAVLAEVTSPAELHAALRDRAERLGVTREVLDEVAGLASGYSAKILSPRPERALGPVSMPAVFGALGVRLVLLADPATEPLLRRLPKRQRRGASGAD